MIKLPLVQKTTALRCTLFSLERPDEEGTCICFITKYRYIQ